jgi:SAM-dependent methyltransferase
MSGEIIGLQDWFKTPPGRYLLEWECQQLDMVVADVFGYHALQLGLPDLPGLRNNRMPYRWVASDRLPRPKAEGGTGPNAGVVLYTDFGALPFSEGSLDLVVLPHSLELGADPHGTLREVERVLVPEGRVVICGFNPASLWGFSRRRERLYKRMGFGDAYLPGVEDMIGYWRLRDWLRLLSFEVESSQFGCYRPSVSNENWLRRFEWMDRAGARWWPILGAVYCVVAVKRVRGMRMLGTSWKPAKVGANAPVPVANRGTHRDAHHDAHRGHKS